MDYLIDDICRKLRYETFEIESQGDTSRSESAVYLVIRYLFDNLPEEVGQGEPLVLLKDVIFDALENIDASVASLLSVRRLEALLRVLHVFVQRHVDSSLLPDTIRVNLIRDDYISSAKSHPQSKSQAQAQTLAESLPEGGREGRENDSELIKQRVFSSLISFDKNLRALQDPTNDLKCGEIEDPIARSDPEPDPGEACSINCDDMNFELLIAKQRNYLLSIFAITNVIDIIK